ncbi:MAG: prenyltransferase [Leptospira sp.]|nr:prenyltransferase [Leptospira sp.]
MNFLQRWIFALKIKSWPKLFVPFILGQSFGISSANETNWLALLFGFLFTFSLVSFIVLLNDYADASVDKIKRTLFPDSSLKTIPDLILNKNEVLGVGLIFGFFTIIFGILIEFYVGRSYSNLVSIICILVFLMYSLPPVKLNYRGGGEFLEMIGVGFVLPLFHFYLQNPNFFNLEFFLLIQIYTILSLTSAMASGFSDEESDKLGGKRTFVTIFGNKYIHKTIIVILSISFILLLAYLILFQIKYRLGFSILIIVFNLHYLEQIFALSKKAKTNAFDYQRVYKDKLHYLIWGTLCLFSIYTIYRKFIPTS